MKTLISAAICAAAIFLPTIASAGEVYNREVHQQQRIYHGVRQGTINPRELHRLERREAALDIRRRHYLRTGEGLDAREHRELNQRENNISRTIYRYKHN